MNRALECGHPGASEAAWPRDVSAPIVKRMRILRPTVSSCALLLSLAAIPATRAQDNQGWKQIDDKSGIAVSEKEEAGRPLPSYRGQTKVSGSVLEVLAVVLDDERSREWAKDVAEARVLRSVDPKTEIVYSRSDQTWPVKDRDLVMKRTVQVVVPGEEFKVRLECVPSEKAEVPKVVRIKHCDTVFTLRQVDEGTTDVDFQMQVEPGGHHPEWAVRMASRGVPYETLLGLKKQVKKTRGQYDAEVKKWQRAT
jgi:hypothetical protein